MIFLIALQLQVAQPNEKFVPVVELSKPICWTWEQKRAWDSPLKWEFSNAAMNNWSVALKFDPIRSLKITCGKGWIVIDSQTGNVTFEDCNPNESSRAFWKTITLAFPEIKRAIKESK